MKKIFDLPNESIDIIHKIMKEKGFKTEKETLVYIITKADEEKTLIKEFREEFKNDIVRFRLGLRTAEQNSIIIKDILNTMLFDFNPDIYNAAKGDTKHWITYKSEKELREMIESKKQRKDDKKSRINEE